MATYTLNPTDLVKNTVSAAVTGQATAAADVVNIVPNAGRPLKGRYLAVHVLGAGATATLTFKAGVTGGTPANLAALGDLAVTVPSGETRYVQVDLNRFLQSDGSVQIVVSGASATPTLRAVQLSKAV